MPTPNEITLEDIIDNPKKFGAPTFEEFARDPQKWFGRKDELMGIVDKGSENLNRHVRKHIFKFKQWKCKSLEEVEVIVKDHGLELDDLDIAPQLINMEGDKCDILVEFFEKGTERKIVAPY